MPRVQLQPDEIASIQALLADLASRYDSSEDPDFLAESEVVAHELPRRVRRELVRFKLEEPRDGMLIISGFPVDQERIGATPPHWKQPDKDSPALQEEMLLVLMGSILGECIGWSTQQDGQVMHNIVPIEAHRQEQLGSGSEVLLTWHTEDAFHPFRGDYLGMACLRNPDGVPTTVASLDGIELAPEHLDKLFEPHYTIRPDNSHQQKNKSDDREMDAGAQQSYEEIERMTAEPDKIPLLFGDRQAPYMRLDPYFMDPVEDDPQAQAAFEALTEAIESQIEDVVLQPGDFCLIDNFQAVHGRKPFKARFDGNDRWMKRVNIVRDLRKSRSVRGEAVARVLT